MLSLKKRRPESPRVSSLIGYFEKLNAVDGTTTANSLNVPTVRKLSESVHSEFSTKDYEESKPNSAEYKSNVSTKVLTRQRNVVKENELPRRKREVSYQGEMCSSSESDGDENLIGLDSPRGFRRSRRRLKAIAASNCSTNDCLLTGDDSFGREGNDGSTDSKIVEATNNEVVQQPSDEAKASGKGVLHNVYALTRYFTGSSSTQSQKPNPIPKPASPIVSRSRINSLSKESGEIKLPVSQIRKYFGDYSAETSHTTDADSTAKDINDDNDPKMADVASSTIDCNKSTDSAKENDEYRYTMGKYNIFKYFSYNNATNTDVTKQANSAGDNGVGATSSSAAFTKENVDEQRKRLVDIKKYFSESIGESYEIIDDFISTPEYLEPIKITCPFNSSIKENVTNEGNCSTNSSNLEDEYKTDSNCLLQLNENRSGSDSPVNKTNEQDCSSNSLHSNERDCSSDSLHSNERDCSSNSLHSNERDCSSDSSNLIHSNDSSLPYERNRPISDVLMDMNERDRRTDSSYFSNDEDEFEDGLSRPSSLDLGLDSSYELIDEFKILSPVTTENMPIYENITIALKGKESQRLIELERHNEHRQSVQNSLEEKYRVDHNIPKRVSKTKKDYIIEELIKTEESYIKNLEHICKNYIEFMKEKQINNYRDIYGNIENIYLETETFYANLMVCGDNHEEIGKTFLRHKNLFNRYPSYCKNKKRSQTLLSSKYYGDIINAREETISDLLDLSSYLLAPIQRLAKYEQLLKNLYKYLKSSDPVAETGNLESAILLVQRISRTSNDIIILDSIENNEFSVNQTGEFIEMEYFRMHSPKKMDAVLFMFQKVIIFAAQNSKNAEKYIYKAHIPVDALSRKSEQDSVIFTLEDFYKRKKVLNEPQYILEARSLRVKNDWIEKIEKLLWEQLYKQKEEVKKKICSPRKTCDQVKLLETPEMFDSTA